MAGGGSTCHLRRGSSASGPIGTFVVQSRTELALKNTGAEFTSGYLDDVGLGDMVPRLIHQIRHLESAAAEVGLRLNHNKCEVFGLSGLSRQIWDKAGLGFSIKAVEEATLLGAPIHTSGVDSALMTKCSQLESVLPRLMKMAAHEAFFLLRPSSFLPSRAFYTCSVQPPAAYYQAPPAWTTSSRGP